MISIKSKDNSVDDYHQLYIINSTNGSIVKKLTSDGEGTNKKYHSVNPVYSLDGNGIYFEQYDPEAKSYQIFKIKTDGTSLTQITSAQPEIEGESGDFNWGNPRVINNEWLQITRKNTNYHQVWKVKI